MFRLILASASPRRAELLRAAGFRFTVRPSRVPEEPRPGESGLSLARRLAIAKACEVAGRARHGDAALVLGADTVVIAGRRILGKPLDRRDARRMLRIISGRTHRVITAVSVYTAAGTGRSRTASATTEVTFRKMTAREIEWYLDTAEPMDKAGAYGIQGHASLFVSGIRGSYSNVVGLPMELLHRLLPPPACCRP